MGEARVVVKFVGPVRRPGPERSLEVDVAALATVAELLGRLGYAPHEQRSLTVLGDGARLALEASLGGVGVVEILIAIGGG